jgi:hypothetical protein
MTIQFTYGPLQFRTVASQFAGLETVLANPPATLNIRLYPPRIVPRDTPSPHYYKLFVGYLHPDITFYNADRCPETTTVSVFPIVQRENRQITGWRLPSLSHMRV